MDRQLIDTHKDVAILVKSKVLVNSIGSNEEAAKLINDLRKDISCRLFLYKDVWNEMNTYHNRSSLTLKSEERHVSTKKPEKPCYNRIYSRLYQNNVVKTRIF
ncbi:hypothetical protein OSB04_015936 [Centaurea solstitialis]|uniref:Uncharacterized protein n=1 Tax=Centaurea solstitialis TaxID=347529 RepID=A0AA38TB28_9ASTR|nr:hypothetical protein OSB04_015936 [Centaurea solstitialis]